jgi:bifunctional UDP-N-acetylglucosamine pyrophosphorylase/glucosamine-1-phosphate N-acetyltransferase
MIGQLHILLVADAAVDADICGRPAIDWLLDTVACLEPCDVTVSGPEAPIVRDRLTARPALTAPGGAGRSDAADAVTLALRCSVPLVQPATLRRALALTAQPAQAVAIMATRQASWWAEPAVPATAIAVIVTRPADPDTMTAALTAPVVVGGEIAATVTAGLVESLCVSDPADLACAITAVYQRIAAGWTARGVTIDDPASTRVEARVHIEPGARILPHTQLLGDTVIGAASQIGPTVTIRDSRIGANCHVRYAVCQDVEVGDRGNIGPFCWLRSGTRLGADGRAGAFVEVADSVTGERTSIPHFGGLFSADVGRDCNIAGMSGSANFNGFTKNRVTIGDDVSVGAGSILVAPVSLGDGSSTAAGSPITVDVPGGALGVARASQRNFAGWQQTIAARHASGG